MPAEPRRRCVLAAAAVTIPLLAAGCKGVGALGTPPKPLPDVAILHAAISGEELMIARYHAAVASSAALSGTLRPVLAEHEAHLVRLRGRLIQPGASPAPTAAARTPAAQQIPPGTAGLAFLESAEQQAADALVRRLAEAPPSLAQLLASIAASEAAHAVVLRAQRTHR
ncbi:MAG TPA: hypothetical protein VG253_00035 [Streptosporangiaceae bacterium]|nr:hypothetical protein [Streptosporangiaceae bacterium]